MRGSESSIFRREATTSPHWLEQSKLAAAVRLLRSWSKSHFAEPAYGSAECAAIRSGICVVSRDAACEAPNPAFRLQPGVAVPRISRGRKALRGICARAASTRPLGTLKSARTTVAPRHKNAKCRRFCLLLLFLDFVPELVDFLADFIAILSVRIKVEIP